MNSAAHIVNMDQEPALIGRDSRGRYISNLSSSPEVTLSPRSMSTDPESYRLPSTISSSRQEMAEYLELLEPGTDVFRILDGTVYSMDTQLMSRTSYK